MRLALRCIALFIAGAVFLLGAVAFAASPPADLGPAPPASFALIVGSNAPGPGQQELRYAERDAAEMTAVLRDVGGYPAANVVMALHPDRAGLRAAAAAL